MEQICNRPNDIMELGCKGCPWHLKNAPQFLNCAVIVFGNTNNYQYSVKEIAEMTGESENTIEGIINSGKFLLTDQKQRYLHTASASTLYRSHKVHRSPNNDDKPAQIAPNETSYYGRLKECHN